MSYTVTHTPTTDYATKKIRDLFEKYEPYFSSVGFATLLFDECAKSTAKVKFHRRLNEVDFKPEERARLVSKLTELKDDLEKELQFLK